MNIHPAYARNTYLHWLFVFRFDYLIPFFHYLFALIQINAVIWNDKHEMGREKLTIIVIDSHLIAAHQPGHFFIETIFIVANICPARTLKQIQHSKYITYVFVRSIFIRNYSMAATSFTKWRKKNVNKMQSN